MDAPDADVEYLERVELHARTVVSLALDEGWLTYIQGEHLNQTPLQRAVNELARHVRHVHYEGDGCLDHTGG